MADNSNENIDKNIPKVPKAELVGGLHNIGMRNLTSNPFTSMRRSAENQLRSYQSNIRAST